ncbi:MAG: hypothetical protein R2726_04390 [Acidimicrobiales bacterium]
MTTKQKLALAVPLVIAAVAIVAAFLLGGGSDSPAADDRVVEALIPGNNEKVLQQAEVGIDLQSGWDGSLTIDGTPIPLDQLDKVLPLGRIAFQPGPGKVLEYLPAGQNCVVARFWPQATPEQNLSRSWCFTVV